MIQQIKADWRRAKRTGQEPIFAAFWGFTLLAWTGLVLSVPLIVFANL